MKIKRRKSSSTPHHVRVELSLVDEGEGEQGEQGEELEELEELGAELLVFHFERLDTRAVMVLQQKITGLMYEVRKLDTALQEVGFGVRMGFDRDPVDGAAYTAVADAVVASLVAVEGLEDDETGEPVTLEELRAEGMLSDLLELLGIDRVLELVNGWIEGHSFSRRLKKKSSSRSRDVTASGAKEKSSPTPTSGGLANSLS